MSKEIDELKINIPVVARTLQFTDYGGHQEFIVTLSESDAIKWQKQCEKMNALWGKAFIVDGFSFNDGKGKSERGIFIPLPEPDTAEKIVKELANHYDFENQTPFNDLVERAQKLLKASKP